jgi:hypothetical protein
VEPDVCELCQRPHAECLAEPYGDAKAILECREAQLELTERALRSTRAQLAHARELLIKSRDAIDLALEETQQEPEGG